MLSAWKEVTLPFRQNSYTRGEGKKQRKILMKPTASDRKWGSIGPVAVCHESNPRSIPRYHFQYGGDRSFHKRPEKRSDLGSSCIPVHKPLCADAGTLLRYVELLSVPQKGVTMIYQMDRERGADSAYFADIDK